MNFELKLTEHLLNNIAENPQKAAYIINGIATTYEEMGCYAKNIATALSSRISTATKKTDQPIRIGICLPRDSHYVSCILATKLLHCSYVPIDIKTPEERKQFILNDAGVDYLITPDNLDELINYKASGNIADFRCESFSEAYMIYTSGTTGTPKGVSIPYSALYSYMQTVCLPDNFNISSNSIVLQFASVNFDVSVLEIFASLYWGGTLVIAQDEDKHDANRLCQLMKQYEVTYCFLPPSMLSVFPTLDFPSMDTMSAGGEAIPYSVTERILGKYPYRFVNGYGPTESTVITTTHEFKSLDEWRCIGKALPGIICYVVNEKGELVKPGEQGELLIGGKQLTNGYWNRPELNEKAFLKNPFDDPEGIAPILYHSGDLVQLNEDNSYDYLGRIDSQVKLHSHRIELAEITTRLEMHPRVLRAYTRLEDLGNDKHLVTYLSTTDKNEDFSDIREYLSNYVPHYMIPTFWNYVPHFELNINGKIDKTALINEAWRKSIKNTAEISDNERVLANKIAKLIGVEDVNVDADLIDEIGLTSLQIMQIPQDLFMCGFKVTVEDIYTHRTIRKCISNHLTRLSFWYNDPELQPERPVLIWLCGHPNFGFCEEMVSKLAEHYNIFVIESYHTILSFDAENANAKVMNEIYTLMVSPIVEQYDVKVIMGFCLGGDQSLMIADTLFHDKQNKPLVVVIDGDAEHIQDEDHFISINFPIFTKEQNNTRKEIDFGLMSTFPEYKYNGPVGIVLSTIFDEVQTGSLEEQALVPEWQMDYYRDRHNKMPQWWKEKYPEADLMLIDCTHFGCLHDENCLKTTVDYVNAFIGKN